MTLSRKSTVPALLLLFVLPGCDDATTPTSPAGCQAACTNLVNVCLGGNGDVGVCTSTCEADPKKRASAGCVASQTTCAGIQACESQPQDGDASSSSDTADGSGGGAYMRAIGCTNNPNLGPDVDCPSGECQEDAFDTDPTNCDAYDNFEGADDATLCAAAPGADYYISLQKIQGATILDDYYLVVHCEGGAATTLTCPSGVGTGGTGDPYHCM